MKMIRKKTSSIQLRRKQDNFYINLEFSYLYENDKEIGVSVVINNTELIFDTDEDYIEAYISAKNFEDMIYWQIENKNKITEEESDELAHLLWELRSETNTGINQFRLLGRKDFRYFRMI